MKITEINRKSVEVINKAAMEKLKQVAAELGLDVDRGNGTFNPDEFSFKVSFRLPITVTIPTPDAGNLEWGLAPRGTLALLNGREVVIEDSRRTKYLFHFANDNTEKKYIAPFKNFKPVIKTAENSTQSK